MVLVRFFVRCALTVCLILPAAQAQYEVQSLPRGIPYRGILEKNGQAVEQTVSMVFGLYADQGDCTSLADPPPAADWTATRSVNVYRGQFAVTLGEGSGAGDAPIPDALFRLSAIYLSITVDDVRLAGCQTVRPVAFAHRSTGDVPIGTVIDWWPPNADSFEAPEGWQVCDGQPITDPRSPLNGTSTPNLIGRFVMGIDPEGTDTIGTQGGSGTTSGGSAHNHQWSFFSSKAWYSFSIAGVQFPVIFWTNGIGNEGENYYPFATNSASDNTFFTNNESSHSHTFSPPYAKLLKIMRIY